MPESVFAERLDEALAQMHAPQSIGRGYRVKRAHGMAGRGQRVMPPIELPFLRASFPAGVQIEPNVAIETEYALHGMLSSAFELRLGALVRQTCDAHGQWLATERVDEPAIAARMIAEAELVAHALHDAGYFGPFGVDAFTDNGGLVQPRSEINARYSMGFTVGLAAMIVGATRVVIEEWAEKNGELDLKKLGEEALELLEPLAPRSK
jgi:hypothetical protein